MRGLFKRKGSKQWQGRFRIPEELWERRDELRNLGVHEIRQSQEFALSLGTEKQDLAEATYRAKLTAWDARMATWRSMLEGSPVALTHRNTVKANRAKMQEQKDPLKKLGDAFGVDLTGGN